VSNSTPLFTASGRPWALVHFEVALSSFRPVRAPGASDERVTVSIVDDATSRLVLGDDAGVHPGRPIPTALRGLLARTSGAAQATVDGRRVAVARVARQSYNANSWSVLVSAPEPDLGGWRSVGPAPLGMAVAALLLMALVAINLRSGNRELRDASLTDELTGLPNRRLLTDRLEQALTLSRRRGTSCAVLLIDLDRFKEVNDTLGHHHGDELLRSVAGRLRAVCRSSDTVSRLGGDEFAILLPDVENLDAAVALARRCLGALHEPLLVEGVTLDVEASIGIALAPKHGQDGNALLRSADVAMYEAKENNCGVMTYDPDLDVNTPTRLALLGDLRRALQTDQLVLHYQPKVTISTGAVHGVEALVRWQHPDRGLVPPADFIPAAEGTGLILPLTIRTLELAVAQARTWLDAGTAVQVAVNLSPRCLLEPDFPQVVLDLLARHGLPAGLLRLEITEGTIMADPARALAALTSLKASGISLSIDDFGTGYSSMSYLKRLPVDELKIDRSFVSEMLTNSSDDVLVRSSIDLGHNLGLSVVAEGVEDQETADALTRLGCDVVQGYHLARPMTVAAVTDWFAARSSVAPSRAAERVLQRGSSHPVG
jgi:diguanylate cyclase (GGDEF)-like protein